MRRDTLDKILELLGPDQEAAASEYQRLHQRLCRFFEWNSAEDPAALADEAIDRVAKRVAEGDAGRKVQNPSAFARGIARLLLLEEARRRQKEMAAIQQWDAQRKESTGTEAEEIDAALQRCLKKMQPERRSLIERYYLYDGSDKAKWHQKLASELGLTINALRNRALRSRQELEECIRKSLAKNRM